VASLATLAKLIPKLGIRTMIECLQSLLGNMTNEVMNLIMWKKDEGLF